MRGKERRGREEEEEREGGRGGEGGRKRRRRRRRRKVTGRGEREKGKEGRRMMMVWEYSGRRR